MNAMKTTYSIIMIILSMSCNRFTNQNVCGVYTANYNFSMDSLILYSDQTYLNKVYLNDNELFVNKGSWEIHEGEIFFSNFVNYYSQLGISGMNGTWISKIYVRKREVYLNISRDQKLYYKRGKIKN